MGPNGNSIDCTDVERAGVDRMKPANGCLGARIGGFTIRNLIYLRPPFLKLLLSHLQSSLAVIQIIFTARIPDQLLLAPIAVCIPYRLSPPWLATAG
jgi:hypothetical protein